MKALLLAGTAEARHLSDRIADRITLISSLAGVTDNPRDLKGQRRVGGFGGVDGLASFIASENVDLVIDATHPFAAQMSKHAAATVAKTGCALLQLVRAPWVPDPEWMMVPDLDAAATVLPSGARAFLATGRGSIPSFQSRSDVCFILRVMDDKPAEFPLAQGQFLVSQPPFTVAQERATLLEHKIDHMVTRNSGGRGGVEKLVAAMELGIQVVVAERPQLPDAARVTSVDAAVDWLEAGKWLAE